MEECSRLDFCEKPEVFCTCRRLNDPSGFIKDPQYVAISEAELRVATCAGSAPAGDKRDVNCDLLP